MEQKKRIFISFGILIALVVAFFVITSTITKYTGYSVSDDSDSNSQSCFAKQDIRLYINSANSDDTLKKIGLLDYLEYVKIQNCYANQQPCIDKGISNFPAWIINGKQVDVASVEDLAKSTGCVAG